MEERPSRAIKDRATRQDLRREMNVLNDRVDLLGANLALLKQRVEALAQTVAALPPVRTQEPGLASGDGGSDLGEDVDG